MDKVSTTDLVAVCLAGSALSPMEDSFSHDESVQKGALHTQRRMHGPQKSCTDNGFSCTKYGSFPDAFREQSVARMKFALFSNLLGEKQKRSFATLACPLFVQSFMNDGKTCFFRSAHGPGTTSEVIELRRDGPVRAAFRQGQSTLLSRGPNGTGLPEPSVLRHPPESAHHRRQSGCNCDTWCRLTMWLRCTRLKTFGSSCCSASLMDSGQKNSRFPS